MKTHVKLFEQFEPTPEVPKKYFIVTHQSDGRVYGVFDNRGDAMRAYNEYAEEAREEEYTMAGYDEDEDDYIEQDEVDMEEFDPTNRSQVEEVYSCAINWEDRNLVKDLILMGTNPLYGFESPQEVFDFFKGDIDWMPEDVRRRLQLMQRSKKMLGM